MRCSNNFLIIGEFNHTFWFGLLNPIINHLPQFIYQMRPDSLLFLGGRQLLQLVSIVLWKCGVVLIELCDASLVCNVIEITDYIFLRFH